MTDMEIAVGLMEEGSSSSEGGSSHVRPVRTSEDFFKFVTYILEYAKYVAENNEDNRNILSQTTPPLDSSGSSNNSETISVHSNLSTADDQDLTVTMPANLSDDSGAEDEATRELNDDDDDPDEKVTCYCQKPFAGRPMIECSRCLRWIHLSCAKIRKNNIPDVFHCAICKGNKRSASPTPTSQSPPGVKRAKKSM